MMPFFNGDGAKVGVVRFMGDLLLFVVRGRGRSPLEILDARNDGRRSLRF